jgi:LysR family transcriptional regulator, cys regulon transcriptional activator
MNFQQLRIVRETVRRNFNLSDAAAALFTSQSGVSKHIKDLQDELGIELFVRKGKRLLGLTEPGKELVQIVERMLLDARNIKGLADQFRQRDEGQLTIATTHTQARYVLPKVVVEFKRLFPKVHLALHQGSPAEIVSMLQLGEADIGVATERLGNAPELAAFPFYAWRHALIVPKGHPLANHSAPPLETVAEYPLITYHEGFTGRDRIDEAFATAGLSPDVVMSALDADVIKTYVALGLGVGIIASMAYDAERDNHLHLIQTSDLFAQNVTQIALRRGRYLRGYVYRFIELCSPGLTEAAVRPALSPALSPELD